MSDWRRADTEWFYKAKFGTFTHYLADSASNKKAVGLSADEWNRRVDSFDVDRFAAQLAETGSRYHFLTLGQNSGFFCSPNETYDGIVGKPSRLSRRDLMQDLANALTKAGIRAMAYLPARAPALDGRACEAFKCPPLWGRPKIENGNAEEVDRLCVFQRMWESMIREWAVRWGESLHGWWIDGCFDPRMYRHADPPNFRSFAEALKAGNPQALVAFNPGVGIPVISQTEYEDYTCGELDDLLAHNNNRPFGRFVDGAQFHILSYLGEWWGGGQPRFPDSLAVSYTDYVTSHDGVVTWDIPVRGDGDIPEDYLRQLKKIGAKCRETAASPSG